MNSIGTLGRTIESNRGDGTLPIESATVPAPPANIDATASIGAVPVSPPIPPSVGCELAADSGAGLTEYVCGQPAPDGRQSVPDAGLNPRGRRDLGRWDMPWKGGGSTELAWEGAEGQDPLRDESILIIDDCTLYRENLAATFVLYGTAAPSVAWDLPSLVTALEDTTPRIVLVNIATRDCALLLQAAMEISPNVRVIVLGVSEDDESEIVACAEAGVAGYHTRTESLDDLLVLMRTVAAGKSFCSPRVSAILLRRLSALASQRPPAAKELVLTARESQILRMLELGLSNQDIAAQLCIAVHTVKNHVHSVLSKLGVSTRAEAAALSRTVGIPKVNTR
jgi:DNA-binding NarL/FixJ family response regulator